MDAVYTKSISNELSALFNNVWIYDRKFDIIPDKNHFGLAIKYNDLWECRQEFIDELVNTIADWIYNKDRQTELLSEFSRGGRSPASSFSHLLRLCKRKFRSTTDSSLLHGQFGELLLFVLLEKLFNASPILRKMPITTSAHHERFGADAIHFKKEGNKNIIIIGEAKTYTSSYKFNAALKDAIGSIISSYNTHRNEIGTYFFDGFIDKDMLDVAKSYIDNTIDNCEIHLVSIVVYNETKKLVITSQDEIKRQIEEVILEKFSSFDNRNINIEKHPILKRITYIVLPIWQLEDLIDLFIASMN